MQRIPIVTVVLVVANLLAACLLLFQPTLTADFGFRSDSPSLQSAFTNLFLHANLLHLLGNMVFLAVVCSAVEMATGSLRFALVYLASGFLGVATHFLLTRHASDPATLIGASGAIAGCAGYYSVRYQGLKVPVTPKWSVSVAWVTGLWVLLQLLGAFVRIGDATSGLAYWAHLGGFACGVLLSLVFRSPDVGQVRLSLSSIEEMRERSPGAAATAAREHLRHHPNDAQALSQLAEALDMQDDLTGEVSVLVSLLDATNPSTRFDALKKIINSGRAHVVPSARRVMLAGQVKASDPNLAVAVLETVVKGPTDDSQRPEAMLALVGMLADSDPVTADQLAQDLGSQYPLHPATQVAKQRRWIR